MSLARVVRQALRTGGETEGCRACRHFCGDPADIEAELPGLGILSSAYAAVRASDGLCLEHHLVINGRRRCEAFDPASPYPLLEQAWREGDKPMRARATAC